MRQREEIQLYLYRLIHGEEPGILTDFLLGVLHIFSVIYGWAVLCKLALYKYGILRQHKLNCHVISLGNITVGGTGKTPTAQRLATIIRDMGYRVVILNRGYRAGWRGQIGLVSDGEKIYMSAAEAGDEAYLLAKSLPKVSVVIGSNRIITGEYAVNELKADVIILDDGFQHWQLARDLDIVLIDSLNMFGNQFMLPRGTLREPLSNLSRAQIFLLTKIDQSSLEAREMIYSTLDQYNKKALVVESIHKPRCFVEIEEWYKGTIGRKNVPLESVRGHKVLAFSAIGNPSSFEQTILDLGVSDVCGVRYVDHHDYTMAEMQYIMQKAVDENVYALVTTEKDAVKIPAEFIHSDRPLPLYVLSIAVFFTEGYEDLMGLIKKVENKQDAAEI
ncbi:lipid-A-disaccharide kinase [Pelosinus fermentans]|uniref:tetraacyldisaccharide 4'-kinase n=1 Tax=Pelosinus fermentans TaxID=365349 RepID=UPI0002685A60|nr:tetraacyldisaccharide 4'-kinase [Pelosinus fermentans]OAM92739.1 Tetraacyldisaccharide 4'-kinase [Pelosinus fermentans DSM 17108]SDQ55396.1 lipid-A-disaccharide kinase [Pelosinus fermentans]